MSITFLVMDNSWFVWFLHFEVFFLLCCYDNHIYFMQYSKKILTLCIHELFVQSKTVILKTHYRNIILISRSELLLGKTRHPWNMYYIQICYWIRAVRYRYRYWLDIELFAWPFTVFTNLWNWNHKTKNFTWFKCLK